MSKRTIQEMTAELLATEHDHKHDELLEAVRSCMAWFLAESEFLGTFDERMDMSSYSEWACRMALGLPCKEEWEGHPRIVITTARKGAADGR